MSESWLLWGLVFGSIGLGFLIYGRRQQAFMPFICGIGLILFPYFVADTLWLLLIGISLIVLPILVKL